LTGACHSEQLCDEESAYAWPDVQLSGSKGRSLAAAQDDIKFRGLRRGILAGELSSKVFTATFMQANLSLISNGCSDIRDKAL
jgi:hypothetical protein